MQKGISRRIDELGRIVIPVEIRKSLKIRQSDELDIAIDGENIILSKSSSINIDQIINYYILSLGKYLNKNVFFTSKDKILAYYMIDKKIIKSLDLQEDIVNVIYKRRKNLNYNSHDSMYYLIDPIIINGDLIGSIILSSEQVITDEDQRFLEFTKIFFENYLEYE